MTFQPYQYQPRMPGPSAPTMAGGPSYTEQPFGAGSQASVVSRTVPLDEIDLEGATENGTRQWFITHPPDVALQEVLLDWNADAADTASGMTTVTVQVLQRTYDRDQFVDVIDPVVFTSARRGETSSSEPIDLVYRGWPLIVRVTVKNNSNPLVNAFYRQDGLDLWVTLHFAAGDIA